MNKSLAIALLLDFGATPTIAATLKVPGTITSSEIGGAGIRAGDSFRITAEISEPPVFQSPAMTSYAIDALTAEVGFETISLITPSNSAVLDVTTKISGSTDISLFISAGETSISSEEELGILVAEWAFEGMVGSSFAELAALDFTSFSRVLGTAQRMCPWRVRSRGPPMTCPPRSPCPPPDGFCEQAWAAGYGTSEGARLSRIGPAFAPT